MYLRDEPQPAADIARVQLLEELTAALLESLGLHDRMAAALNFFVPALAHGASICVEIDEAQNNVLSTGSRCGTPLTLPLRNGEGRIGVLQLDWDETHAALPQGTLEALAERTARALTYSLAYEREQRVSFAFQYAAVTTELPYAPGFRLDAIYEAGRAEALVGGDWYDAFLLDDGRLIVSVGDVMGSGLPAALAMVKLRQSLRTVALLHPDLLEMLEAANRTLLAEFPDRLATTFVALIDPITHTCSYANAGHPPPLLRLVDGTTVELHTHGVPLGVPGFSRQLRPDHILLAPSSMLLLYTDGLTEVHRRPLEGEAVLRETLAALDTADDAPSRAIFEQVLANGARDDVAIMTVYIEPHPDIPRWRFDPRWVDASRRVRGEIRDVLSHKHFSTERLAVFDVIYAEMVANLIRHAPGTAELLLQLQPDGFVLHVLDKGPGFKVAPRLPNDLFCENGRGLYLISKLADGFSAERRPGGGSHARITLLNSKGAYR